MQRMGDASEDSRLRPDRERRLVKPPTRQSCRHAIAGGLLHRRRHHPGRRHEMLHEVNRREVGTRLLTWMSRTLDTAGLARS
jgi:hypothetical protein